MNSIVNVTAMQISRIRKRQRKIQFIDYFP
jgi:hypothetical protein